MSQQLLKLGKRLNSNVAIGKFTVVVDSTGTYENGIDVPAAANAGPIAGVADESILTESMNDYSAGQYQITSGTAWPSNSIPSSATGRGIAVVVLGISRVVASAAISIGDDVNIADSQGRIKTVDETTGTTVYVLGKALQAATAAGDIIKVMVNPMKKVV